ncbi:NAD(P)-dependent oxidoreductase [Allokutzneria sp. A3M-2-11 16]|uniref:NAD-dependent epimerase/dehydratase family protein n=1 Tax=Allokutzneria sp. A3M-2-11 16 TaxID=2962043 RepID=UPI0020B69D43|nr:NAD(P)-dependent oxidoreductase [Allokutzneria sp. A3M-2-11 16]MCP3799393.1 NAD(P)-dependent oxidoreductase [Allokutzneria sp. A3M-2-11 16]
MRVLVAGATGVIGRSLLPLLRAEGHHVTALVRPTSGWVSADAVEFADALDAEAVETAVRNAEPEVVVHQLSALRAEPGVRWQGLERTARLRVEGTANLVAAAEAAGAQRFVAQSVAFATAPQQARVLDEDAPLYLDAPDTGWAETVRAVEQLEHLVLRKSGVAGVVLRYGVLYGEGTLYDSEGMLGQAARAGRLPLVGDGNGVSSFVRVDDAAAAAVVAVHSEQTGVFNIVDDDPAPARDWVPHFAHALGGPPPKAMPGELAARVLGWFPSFQQTGLCGASNQRAKDRLGWSPAVPSWRNGFLS